MKVSSDEFNEIEQAVADNPSVLPELIADKILKSLEIEGNNLELVRMISAFKEKAKNSVPPKPFTLPLSLLTKEVIKSIAPELNHVIKQKDSGLMGVLNAASAFVQVYNLNGQPYTFGSLLLDAQLEKFKSYEGRIKDFVLGYNNEV
jgi:hypothetical protein